MCHFGAVVVKSCCALPISFSLAVAPRGPHVVVGKSTNWRRTTWPGLNLREQETNLCVLAIKSSVAYLLPQHNLLLS